MRPSLRRAPELKIGDRVRWRIWPDARWRDSLVLGVMKYAAEGSPILIGDGVHLGMPISTSWVEKTVGADVPLATALREAYLKQFPGALKP